MLIGSGGDAAIGGSVRTGRWRMQGSGQAGYVPLYLYILCCMPIDMRYRYDVTWAMVCKQASTEKMAFYRGRVHLRWIFFNYLGT